LKRLKNIAARSTAVLLVLLYVLALNFCSCTPQKRFSRLVEKHPSLIEKQSRTVYDTIITPGTKTDTLLFFNLGKRDTFIIQTPESKTTLYVNEEKTAARVEQEQRPDTTINSITYLTNYIEKTEAKAKHYFTKLLKWAAGFIVVFFLLNQVLKRVKISIR
jgi:hypothetical protein